MWSIKPKPNKEMTTECAYVFAATHVLANKVNWGWIVFLLHYSVHGTSSCNHVKERGWIGVKRGSGDNQGSERE